MFEKVPCRRCSVMILNDTYEKNSGLCMPCKNGTRVAVERSKLQYERDRLYRQSEEYIYWVNLVKKVDQESWSKIQIPDQHYFVITILIGEVFNGGFDQYFFNSSGDYYNFTKQVLMQHGEEDALSLLLRAKQLIFADRAVPVDCEQRRELLHEINAVQELISAELLVLEKQFIETSGRLSDLLRGLVMQYGLYTPFD